MDYTMRQHKHVPQCDVIISFFSSVNHIIKYNCFYLYTFVNPAPIIMSDLLMNVYHGY